MTKIGIMIGTHLFEKINEAHAALRRYHYIDGSNETFLVTLPEKPYSLLLQRTKRQFPINQEEINSFNEQMKDVRDIIEKEVQETGGIEIINEDGSIEKIIIKKDTNYE